MFTVEWEQMLPSTSAYARAIEEFVDADVASCEDWDTTYLGSDTVSHFDLEYDADETPVSRRVKRSCRLLRYRFSIAGLGMPREMLYLVVEDEDEVRRAKKSLSGRNLGGGERERVGSDVVHVWVVVVLIKCRRDSTK